MNLKISISNPINENLIRLFFSCIFLIVFIGLVYEWLYVFIGIPIVLIFLFLNLFSSNKITLNKKQLSVSIGWTYRGVYLWKSIEAISTIKSGTSNSTIYIVQIVLKEKSAKGLNRIQIQIDHKDKAENITDLLNYYCNEYKYEDIYTEDIDKIGFNQFLDKLHKHDIAYKWYN